MAKTAKLETYIWEGTNRRGERMRGEQNATNPAIIKADLRRQGIMPRKIRKKSKALFSSGKIKSAEVTAFTRQLATMLTAGIPLIQSIDLIGRGHTKPSIQTMIGSVKSTIEGGGTVTEALRKHPTIFNELFCNLVSAGERSGSLDVMLDRIASYKEKTDSMKGKIKKALFYPTAIVIVAVLVSVCLLIFVVPQFESLFAGFGAQLPALTRMVINLSKFLQHYWLIIFGSIAIFGVIASKMIKRSPTFLHNLDRVMLKLPILGVILVKASIARFARTLATTFAAGLPLVEALDAVAGAAGNRVYSTAIKKIKEDVSTGQTLQQALLAVNLFPPMVVQMIAIGEESGTLETMLSKVASIYEEEVDNAVDSLSSLIEPLIMVVLGVLVGGMVIAMYLPIFKMGSVV